MLVLIWAALLFSETGSNADADPSQKPTLTIPPLTEGQQATLTCTAPGLCSGSVPNITWAWTAEHNGTEVTCRVSFANITTEETATLNVTLLPLLEQLLLMVKQPQVIIAFVTGIVLSAAICCLARRCPRRKQKNTGNMVETLELVTTEVAPLMDAGQSVEINGTHNQEGAVGGPEAAGQLLLDGDLKPKEVEYSSIVFSTMKRRSPAEAGDTQETADTEYAEIKMEERMDQQDYGRPYGELLEGNDEGVGEEKEESQCMFLQEEDMEAETMAVNFNVDEITADF